MPEDLTELYHVRISVAGESRDETKVDLTETQLQQQFLGPYREGKPITVNGRTISPEDLERIRISRTGEPSSDIISRIRTEDRSSSVISIGGPSMQWRAASRGDDITDELIQGPPGYLGEPPADPEKTARRQRVTVPSGPGDRRSVFLVHGRDKALTTSMEEFLRSLDLKVIEWEMAVRLTGEPNPYIGDIIQAGFEAGDAVVVLATPDDRVKLDPALGDDENDPDLIEAGQPRQNVVFEAGMSMALAPNRTLIVAVPGTKILSDISGRHIVFLSDSAKARRRLVGRLQNIGLAVDDSGEAWLTAGSFGDS